MKTKKKNILCVGISALLLFCMFPVCAVPEVQGAEILSAGAKNTVIRTAKVSASQATAKVSASRTAKVSTSQATAKVSASRTAKVSASRAAAKTPASRTAAKKKAAKKKARGLIVKWKAVRGAKKYVVYRSTNGRRTWKKLGATKSTKYIDQTAKKTRRNIYKIVARSGKNKILKRQTGSKKMYLDGFFGISREDFLAQLKKHRKDKYYLGTPYLGGDNRSPKGDTKHRYGNSDIYGKAGMNCTGFVWRALFDAGADVRFIPVQRYSGNSWQNPSRPGVNTWSRMMRGDQNGIRIVSYRFNSIKALLASGKAEKGDIIYMHPSGRPSPKTGDVDAHVGIFYGSSSSDNKFWHSGPSVQYGTSYKNVISKINAPSPDIYYLLKWSD